MGMSLAEIKLVVSERRAGGRERMLQAMIVQRDKLNDRADELSAMLRFVDAKILWLRGGAIGTPPEPSVSGDVLAMSRAPKSNARR
jgi:DNA-binding transcriptional MerR regulator